MHSRTLVVLVVSFVVLLLAGVPVSPSPARSAPPGSPTATVTPTPESEAGYLPVVAANEFFGPSPTPTPTPTLTPTPLPPTPTPAPPTPTGQEARERAVIEEIQRERAANGRYGLLVHAALGVAARRHAEDMATNNFTDHRGSDGSSAPQRMSEAGYHGSAWGEIIGWGFGGDASRMVEWWMNSPVHRGIILSSDFDDVGAGYAYNPASSYRHYWTVNFGRRAAGIEPEGPLYRCTFELAGPEGGSRIELTSPRPCEAWGAGE